jgi:hypothetical protein
MKCLLAAGLAVALGVLVTGARGEEGAWRAVATTGESSAAPAAALGQPIARSQPTPAPSSPTASLGKPVPIASSRVDVAVQRVNFSPEREPGAVVVRGASPDLGVAQSMPSGPISAPWTPGMHVWRRADDQLPPPTAAGNAPLSIGGPVVGATPLNAPIANAGPLAGPVGAAPLGPSLFGTGCDCNCGGGTCGHGSCAGGMGCSGCDCNRWYVGLEALIWGMKGDPTVPLASRGVNLAPNLDAPPTAITFGDKALGDSLTTGGRLTVGWWFSDAHVWGLEASAFWLGTVTNSFHDGSLGNATVGRPIIDVAPGPFSGQPSQEFVALSNAGTPILGGQLDITRRSTLWGAEFNLMRSLACCENGYLNLLIGYRHLGLEERLTISESLMTLTELTGIPAGTMFAVQDRFATNNNFYGGQLGLAGEYRLGRWAFGFKGKIALGCTQEWAEITGSTTRTLSGGTPVTLPGGLLALQGTNIGRYFRTEFGVVPEGQVLLGYQLCSWCRVNVGYNFLWWNSVIRPSGLIDPAVNGTYVPFRGPASGVARPMPVFNSSDFWAQGLTLGVEFNW